MVHECRETVRAGKICMARHERRAIICLHLTRSRYSAPIQTAAAASKRRAAPRLSSGTSGPLFIPAAPMTFRFPTLAVASLCLPLLLAACGGGETAPAADTPATDAQSNGKATALSTTAVTSLVPVMPVATYTVDTSELMLNNQFDQGLLGWAAVSGSDTTIVASEVRSGGHALKTTGAGALQALAATLLQPGKSYTLTVKARNFSAGSTTMALRFREKTDGASYRTYQCAVTTTYQTCTVDFTVPAYAAMAELAVMPQATTVIVDSASLVMRSAIAQTEAVTTLVGSY